MIKLKVDTSLFDTGMILMQNAAIPGTVSGMKRALEEFKDDALNKPPACPRKTGWMAEHHVTNVNVLGKLVQGSLSVVDTPYAASLHEGISRWGTPYTYKTPGTGMKWIESKALMYKQTYFHNIVNAFTINIRAALRSVR